MPVMHDCFCICYRAKLFRLNDKKSMSVHLRNIFFRRREKNYADHLIPGISDDEL